LLESELFGHRKGSFTGAIQDKKGLFEEADGGTIFLDEVGSMSPMLQSRLLRVLQEREVRRVGEKHFDLCQRQGARGDERTAREEGQGRNLSEDLYYRLNVIPITLPKLRDTRKTFPCWSLISSETEPARRPVKPFQVTRQAMEALCQYDWPGNVRELENAIERACVLSEADTIRRPNPGPFSRRNLESAWQSASRIVIGFRQDAGAFDCILQLADVAWPVV